MAEYSASRIAVGNSTTPRYKRRPAQRINLNPWSNHSPSVADFSAEFALAPRGGETSSSTEGRIAQTLIAALKHTSNSNSGKWPRPAVFNALLAHSIAGRGLSKVTAEEMER